MQRTQGNQGLGGVRRWTAQVSQTYNLGIIPLAPAVLSGAWLVPSGAKASSAPRRFLDFWRASRQGRVYLSFADLRSRTDEAICRWVNSHGWPLDLHYLGLLDLPDGMSDGQRILRSLLFVTRDFPLAVCCDPTPVPARSVPSPLVHCAEVRRQARLVYNLERAVLAFFQIAHPGHHPAQVLLDATGGLYDDLTLAVEPASRNIPRWHYDKLVTQSDPPLRSPLRTLERPGNAETAQKLLALVWQEFPYRWTGQHGLPGQNPFPRLDVRPPVEFRWEPNLLRCLYLELLRELWGAVGLGIDNLRARCIGCGLEIAVNKMDGLCGTCRRRLKDRELKRERRAAQRRRPSRRGTPRRVQ
jgi:hypothetical protein